MRLAALLLAALLVAGCSRRDETGPAAVQARADELPGTVVTPHLEEPIDGTKNVLWCATFQLAWNELCDLAGGDIHMADEPPMVAALNKRAATEADLDPNSFVAMAGIVGEGILERIREALAERFHGTAEPQLVPAEGSLPPDWWVAYAYLLKHLPFESAFTRFDRPLRFAGKSVAQFGILGYSPGEADKEAMARQVDVLSYASEDDFVIELKTRSTEDRLILAKVTPAATLAETVEAVRGRIQGAAASKIEQSDILAIPVFDFSVLREYSELYRRGIVAKDPRVHGTDIWLALQRIRFRLDETGAVLESEALLLGAAAESPRFLIFNKPFLVLLERRGASGPYFALWVANAELMVRMSRSAP